MPVNNALTPEGSNALGAAFGYYPQLKKYRQFNDPSASAEMPLQFMRSRFASTMGAIPDLMNLKRSLLPAEAVQALESYGQIAPEVPYGSQYFQENLPLPPQGPAQQMAGAVGSVVPLSPAEILQSARLARQAALAGGKFGKQGLGMLGEEVNATLLGERPKSFFGAITPKPMYAVEPNANLLAQSVMKPKAEVSPLGFYSAVEQQALNIPRKQGTGASFLNDLSKGQDVKKYEIEAMGLEDFLKGKTNVTRQEVQDFIQNNKINVEERQLGGTITQDPIGIAKRKEVFDKYDPQIQAMYKEMDNPTYKLVDRQVGPEEYQRGVILQNRVYRGEEITAQEQAQLNSIMNRINGVAIKEFPNVEEARKFYLGMSSDDKFRHSIMPLNSSTELQQKINQLQHIRDTEANAAYVVPEVTPTKYQKFQLPGGENYRELLLTLPDKKNQFPDFEQWITNRYGGSQVPEGVRQAARKEYERQSAGLGISGGYQSSHFNEPNILAHMRVNDRVDAEGKKMLLIEEVQSDWHQAGREKGYKGKGTLTELPDNYFVQELKTIDGDTMYVVRDNSNPSVIINKDYNRQSAINGVINELNATSAGGVPDAPFKDTWHQLALKRAIKEAVDKGYDRIGLTTGAQQAERYDLSKQINKIDYRRSSNNTFELGVVGKNGESVDLPKRFYTAEELPSVLGKEVADKIIKGEGQGGGGRMTLSGLDLQVGGEGMKKYYDEVYPNFLNKFGKKYGAQVGETKVKTETSAPAFVDYIVGRGNFNDTTVLGIKPDGTTAIVNQNANSMEEAQQLANRYKEKHLGGGQQKVRYLDITPEMRKAVKEGQPLASITNHLANAMA